MLSKILSVFKSLKTPSIEPSSSSTSSALPVRSPLGIPVNTKAHEEMAKSPIYRDFIYSNLHFLQPLSEKEGKILLEDAISAASSGKRPESITDQIKALRPDLEKKVVSDLANSLLARCQAARTHYQSFSIGIEWYIWQTCQDERVRASHNKMQGVAYCISDPPEPELLVKQPSLGPYFPGQAYCCRCFAAPVLDPDDEKFPLKVYRNGKIERMGKKAFKELVNETSYRIMGC